MDRLPWLLANPRSQGNAKKRKNPGSEDKNQLPQSVGFRHTVRLITSLLLKSQVFVFSWIVPLHPLHVVLAIPLCLQNTCDPICVYDSSLMTNLR
jgi:hypothetical protein